MLDKKFVSKEDLDRHTLLLNKKVELNSKLVKTQIELEEVKTEILKIELLPFVEGEEVICNIPPRPLSGKSAIKLRRCKVYIEKGTVYVRPFTLEGSISKRSYPVYPMGDRYTEYLRKCDE